MKRYLYLGLILSMLLLIVFPPAVHAEDTRTPFDYLSQDQQTYASAVRGGVAEAKKQVSSARADLGTSFLQGYMEWSTAVYKTLGALNGSIGKLKALTPPEGFSDVNAKCQALPEASMGRLYAAFSFGGGPESLIETAQMVGELEGDL